MQISFLHLIFALNLWTRCQAIPTHIERDDTAPRIANATSIIEVRPNSDATSLIVNPQATHVPGESQQPQQSLPSRTSDSLAPSFSLLSPQEAQNQIDRSTTTSYVVVVASQSSSGNRISDYGLMASSGTVDVPTITSTASLSSSSSSSAACLTAGMDKGGILVLAVCGGLAVSVVSGVGSL